MEGSVNNMALLLPTESLLHILSYLDYQDILNCMVVSKRLSEIASSDTIWKPLCKKYWDVRNCPANVSWKSVFMTWYNDYGRYINIFKTIRTSWDQIEDYMDENFHDVYESLQDGLSERELDNFEDRLNQKLPEDLRCSYRIHNGQKRNMAGSGLFGSLQVYNSYTSLSLLDLRDATNMIMEMRSQYNSWQFAGSIILFQCFHSGSMRFIALTDEHGYSPGQVYFPSRDIIKIHTQDASERNPNIGDIFVWDDFIIADTFQELLTNFSKKLDDDMFSKPEDKMLLLLKDPNCIEKTNFIEVSVATCFCPEESTINPPDFLHAYQVTFTMDNEAPDSESCQLETRHWVITDDNGKEQRVDGPGVIGEYPIMRPGGEYSWISCCTFKTTYGNMTGHFTMRNLKTENKFDLKCPVFHMKCYSHQTSEDRNEKIAQRKKDL